MSSPHSDLKAHTVTNYRVTAKNLSPASENKIHDDAVARQYGFSGGLVPGVEVYAYATYLAVGNWGRAWLERGTLTFRLSKPVYDGAPVDVLGEPHGDEIAVTLQSAGRVCLTGSARLPETAGSVPAIAAYPAAAPPAVRPPADAASLAVGTALGIKPFRLTDDMARGYLADVSERLSVYTGAGATLLHPGLLLRQCNSALKDCVLLGPWVHTGSTVTNFATAQVGDEISVRARVARYYESKGHQLVDLDMIVIANGDRVAAHVRHTAIVRLRPPG